MDHMVAFLKEQKRTPSFGLNCCEMGRPFEFDYAGYEDPQNRDAIAKRLVPTMV
jgi:hypothetical protein